MIDSWVRSVGRFIRFFRIESFDAWSKVTLNMDLSYLEYIGDNVTSVCLVHFSFLALNTLLTVFKWSPIVDLKLLLELSKSAIHKELILFSTFWFDSENSLLKYFYDSFLYFICDLYLLSNDCLLSMNELLCPLVECLVVRFPAVVLKTGWLFHIQEAFVCTL